ncbi:MAG: autotransporter-associated beta strand repeat-containing protein [Clostridiales bacterium]|nr:autotransporter-associated beta strand repeat-containing protein [Clostridiales bacterium]
MKKLLLICAVAAALSPSVSAQRFTDDLDRGMVAMKTDQGVFCSWRITDAEWDGTLYNIYRGTTKLNDAPLRVSNYTDAGGSLSDTYSVKAVVNGVEQTASKPVKVWEKNYTVIKPKHAAEITVALVPNDATAADVDGDGELEIIMKYDNHAASYSKGDNGIFTVIECLEMDGTVKWWINAGPNMGDFQNNEINIAAYDWDMDGRAEVVFRAADGTQIHMADGNVYTIGDASINYRNGDEYPAGQWFMHWGKEYLVYADGLTGKPYEVSDFPLKRVEDENNPGGLLSGGAYDKLVENEWGDGYGHRSSKYFFAAPYLDGKKPSLFLGRGIYTKHKFITYDIDPVAHRLVERWRWNSIGGAWHGQGYHNMGIADVDWDGRDEIVFGSMVIDDNGFGLSTTGLGHGDAQHCGDFDPYIHGQEIFACNEDTPNNNYRDATTSKIYYRTVGSSDDGRCVMGNFIDDIPGSEGVSAHDDNLIAGVSHKAAVGTGKNEVHIAQNFRVFWDGDLCDESFNYSNGKNTAGAIYKAREGQIALLEGSKTNNDTKGTPCYQGDIMGDWREEYIMRDADNNIRIYTTNIPTSHRIYSLWYDHQYRNAMVWQMCGYNQPPHVSFALSEFEDITIPPYPLTIKDRVLVGANGTIDASMNGKNVLVFDNADMSVTAAQGVAPAVLTINAPSWVQGHDDNNNITTSYYTTTINGGTIAGSAKLVKQGDGKLVMPNGTHSYNGPTEVWAGTIALDGELSNSAMWLNRFAVLQTSSLSVPKGIDMEYGAVISLGDDTQAGALSTGDLTLGFGSIVEIDLFADGTADRVNATVLTVETKDWTNGPEYMQPIFKFTEHVADGENFLPSGKYLIGEIETVKGNLGDIVMLGIDDMKKAFVHENGKLYLDVVAYEAGKKVWTGGENALWDLDHTSSFKNEAMTDDVFVPGDEVIFDDSAVGTNVKIDGRLKPGSVTFNNSEKNYTLNGDGQIVGAAKLVKEGEGTLTINNINSYTGGTYINGGKVVAGVYANEIGNDLGALSDIKSRIYIKNNATLSANATGTLGQTIVLNGKATIEVPQNVTLTTSRGIISGGLSQIVTKSGKGTWNMAAGNSGMSRLVIAEGTVRASEADNRIGTPANVEFINGTLYDADNIYSYSTNTTNYIVEEGNKGTLYLDSRCDYTGKLTGKGTLSVYASSVRGELKGDWSKFEGELSAGYHKTGSYDPAFLWSNSYGMPKAALNISSNVTFDAQNNNVSLGNIKGTGTYNGTGTLTVGNDTKNITFNGKFSGKPKIVKAGKCDWVFSKAIGGEITSFTARDGSVSLNTSSPFKTAVFNVPVTINGNAKLRGRGTVANLTVSGNGILEPGSYSSTQHYGPMYSTGNVTVSNGATLSLYIRKANASNSHSYIDVTGTLKLDGIVTVALDPSYVPAIGDEFEMWKAGKFSGEPNLELPELPEGMQWDTTELLTTSGKLRVAESAGVDDILADNTPVVCEVYNIMGAHIGSVETTKGEAEEAVKRELNPNTGVYILRLIGDGAVETQKVRF